MRTDCHLQACKKFGGSEPSGLRKPRSNKVCELAADLAFGQGLTTRKFTQKFSVRLLAEGLENSYNPGSDFALPGACYVPANLQDGAAVEHGVFSIPLAGNFAVADVSPPGAREPISRLDFIAGPENRLAALAVDSLFDGPHLRFNPLVIVGPSGTGKTHLVRGIVERWISRDEKSAGGVLYFNGSDFANQLKAAIDADAVRQFQSHVRSAALLVIDDLTQLQSRRPAQQELISTLDAIIDHGGQIVAASRTPPERISNFPAALRSRLVAGLVVPLVAPAAATRLALVERLAQSRSIPIVPSAARALADGLNVTAPELLGALMELDMRSRLSLAGDVEESTADIAPRTIDSRAVRQWLAERRLQCQPSLGTIARVAAKHFGLRVAQLLSPSRQRAVVQARGVAMYLGRQLTAKSLEQLGKHFGGRDHTTVLHSYRSIEERLRSDPAIRRAVSDIRRSLAQA